MNNIKILYCDRIDVSEGFDTIKTSASKECDISQYWCLLDKGFKFQSYVCNKCNDLLMMSMNLSDIAILKLDVLTIAVLLAELEKVKL